MLKEKSVHSVLWERPKDLLNWKKADGFKRRMDIMETVKAVTTVTEVRGSEWQDQSKEEILFV